MLVQASIIQKCLPTEKIAEAEGMGRQQNRNDAIILFIMSNARYVRIVGTARNTNYGYSIWNMAIYGTEDLKVDETTTPVATKSDMITNQAATQPVSTSEQTTAKNSIKVAKTKVKKAAKDKNSKSAKISLKKIEVLWFMIQDKETKHEVAQTVFIDERKELR